jgi:hypothetical protein
MKVQSKSGLAFEILPSHDKRIRNIDKWLKKAFET